MKILVFMSLVILFSSCGKREDKTDPPKGLEGRWQSYEVSCYRELVFLKDQFFQEVSTCNNSSTSIVSTGIWSRSADNVISMKYLDSTDQHLTNVELHAIVDLDQNRIMITNLKETVLFRRVSDKPEVRYPNQQSARPPPPSESGEEDCDKVNITINNTNHNDNDNKNVNCEE